MGYDRGDSFPFDFEPNRIPFGSKLKGKLSPQSYPIQCERKWKHSFLSVNINIQLFKLTSMNNDSVRTIHSTLCLSTRPLNEY